jgi:hypothetical protein
MSTGAPDQCVVTELDPSCDPDADALIVAPTLPPPSPDDDTSSNIVPLFGAGAVAQVLDLDPQLVITELEG